jgi:hypothetical protein
VLGPLGLALSLVDPPEVLTVGTIQLSSAFRILLWVHVLRMHPLHNALPHIADQSSGLLGHRNGASKQRGMAGTRRRGLTTDAACEVLERADQMVGLCGRQGSERQIALAVLDPGSGHTTVDPQIQKGEAESPFQ